MKQSIALLLISSLITPSIFAQSLDQRTEQSRAAVKSFMGELKHQLKTTLKKEGPIAAIKVCNVVAPSIAQKQSNLQGWEVSRTSLKVRNPNNAADSWERSVLESFESRKNAGEALNKMEHFEIVMEDGQQWFRYMKAIPTAAKPCLLCHGSNLKPQIAATLDKLYPNDMARGYSAGDIRGAFSIRQPVDH